MNRRLSRHFRRLAAVSLPALLAAAGLSAAFTPAAAVELPELLGIDWPREKPTQGYPPPPLSVFGDAMPAPGRLTISVIPQFGESAHLYMGTNNVTPQQVATMLPGWYWNPTTHYTIMPQAMFAEAQAFSLAYGIMPDLSIVIASGTQEKHSHLVTFYGSSNLVERGTSFPGTDSLLDSQAALIWRAYEDKINRVKINLGMGFPTGSDHNMGGAVMNTTGGYNVGWAFYGMQTGWGTYNLLPGILYAGVLDGWTWGLCYRATIPLGVNSEGYRWGTYQDASGWVGYSWIRGLTTTLRLGLNVQSQITGAGWLETGKLPSANPENWGGKWLSVFGGADIDGKLFGAPGFSIGLEAGVPVYQNINGPQLARVWQAGMALRWRVGEEEKEEKVSRPGIFKGSAAPEPAPNRSPWDGVHLGANLGYTWVTDTSTHFTYLGSPGSSGFVSLYAHGGLPADLNLDGHGALIGGQAGYDRVFWDRYLVGLESDLGGLTVGNTNYASWRGKPLTYLQAGRNQHFFGTVRGRIGYLVTPTVLVYGIGGVAYGENDLNATYFVPSLKPTLFVGGSMYGFVDMMLGWTAGAGVEWMFSPRWSLKAEYLFYDFGTANTANIGPLYYNNTTALNWSSVGYRADFSGNIVRMGVNYHFNGLAAEPVLAKF
jgi:opacity protein-like surface antigen